MKSDKVFFSVLSDRSLSESVLEDEVLFVLGTEQGNKSEADKEKGGWMLMNKGSKRCNDEKDKRQRVLQTGTA